MPTDTQKIEVIEIGVQGPPGGGTLFVASPPPDDDSNRIVNSAWVRAFVAQAIADALEGYVPVPVQSYAAGDYFAENYAAG